MKTADNSNFRVILKTGKLHEIDMAANALEEEGIPFMRRQASSGGMVVAMPIAPTPGPGVWWDLLVPEVACEDAKAVLSQLPMEMQTDPDIWDFAPTDSQRKGWKVYAFIVVAIIAAGLISFLTDIFR